MENIDPNLGNQTSGGALSIYGQSEAAMDDFPVLKAFQQYIDAEQSKSRKRMILLCMFFGALMTILVAVFVFMLAQMNRDKQHVNDQLIQFLMKERERGPTAAPPQAPAANPAQDAALKAVTETLTALQRQMAEQKKAAEEEAAAQPTKAELELERKAEREAAKIRKAQEQLAAEKRKLAEEREKIRQAEIERQRRRLYPDYYKKAEEGVRSPSAPSVIPSPAPSPKPAPKKVALSDADIDDILREVDALKAEDEAKAKDKAKEKEKKREKEKAEKSTKKDGATETNEDGKEKSDKPIEYFTDTEYAIPVNVDGEDAGFSIPLN